MAKWSFWKPIKEMDYRELADELVNIVRLSKNSNVDVAAITQVLNVIDEKYPSKTEFRPFEEVWSEFCEQYMSKPL